jgi:hypothetical protein
MTATQSSVAPTPMAVDTHRTGELQGAEQSAPLGTTGGVPDEQGACAEERGEFSLWSAH